jgi:LysW-gamma-L-lysine carboxypeptidase
MNFSTLIELVEQYSPTGQEGPAVETLVKRMGRLGFGRAYADPAGNAIGIKGEGPRQILLLGHIDTVPGQIPLRVEGDLLYGRGAVDAKGPLAAFVDAAAGLQPAPGWQVVVIGAVDEEGDSAGARYACSQYSPEFAIIGEPSRWDRVTLGYKGSAWVEIRLSRAVAHSAGQAESACEAAFNLWGKIQAWAGEFNQGRERLFDQVTPALRGFASGDDGFEDWATLQVGARLPRDLPPEAWYARLGELAPGESLEPVGYPIPAYLGDKNNPLVRAFLSGIRLAGGKPGFVLKSGTADLNLVAPAWGCPAAAYGPGDSTLDHTPQECLSLEEFALSVQVLQEVLMRLMEASG